MCNWDFWEILCNSIRNDGIWMEKSPIDLLFRMDGRAPPILHARFVFRENVKLGNPTFRTDFIYILEIN